jgi:hypothetical protein
VTVTSVSSTRISGTMDLTLSNGGTMRGAFDAPSCAVAIGLDPSTCSITGLPAPGTGTCQ